MTTTALLLAALIAGPQPRPADPAAHPVPAEMAPAPGRWEVEDAPAYFSDRTALPEAIAPQRLGVDMPADLLPGHRRH